MLNSCGINLCGESNVGLFRKKNEDNFGIVNMPGRTTVLAVVADGIGGHKDGDIASFICCRDLMSRYLALPQEIDSPARAETFLAGALEAINSKIFTRNAEFRGDRPMGTTMIAAVFGRDFLTMLNVGDSRLYEFRPGNGLEQLSTDDSLCNNPEALAKVQACHPNSDLSCVLCKAVGTRASVEPQIRSMERHADSCFLLCSDGAYRGVTKESMIQFLTMSDSPRSAVNCLMRAALLAGGQDNITLISVYPDTPGEDR